jgi:hypothetical protein
MNVTVLPVVEVRRTGIGTIVVLPDWPRPGGPGPGGPLPSLRLAPGPGIELESTGTTCALTNLRILAAALPAHGQADMLCFGLSVPVFSKTVTEAAAAAARRSLGHSESPSLPVQCTPAFCTCNLKADCCLDPARHAHKCHIPSGSLASGRLPDGINHPKSGIYHLRNT